jgi:cell division protein FtsQ
VSAEAATVRRRGLPSAVPPALDKRFRRAEVKPARRRTPQARWRIAARVAGVIIILALVGYLGATRVLGARLLSVSDYVIRGTHRLTQGEVEALVGDLRGTNLLQVRLDEIEAQLRGSPWVADVTLRRVLPSTLDIRIVERVPMAIARIGSQLYLIDDGGVIVGEYGPQYGDLDLPIVDGLAAPRAADGAVMIDPARAQVTARFLREIATRPDLRRAISQVDVATAANVTVMLGDNATVLYLGDERFVERLQTYLEMMPALAERQRVIDYVDLRFGSRVFLKDRR